MAWLAWLASLCAGCVRVPGGGGREGGKRGRGRNSDECLSRQRCCCSVLCVAWRGQAGRDGHQCIICEATLQQYGVVAADPAVMCAAPSLLPSRCGRHVWLQVVNGRRST